MDLRAVSPLHFRSVIGSIGHMKQFGFEKRNWKHALCHGGTLRQVRAGRGYRPLSTREPLHLVLKANRLTLRGSFRGARSFFLIHALLEKYARRFWIRIEQVSVQGDHIHLLIRAGRRSNYQAFFRVFAGQIAQRFQNLGLVTDTPGKAADQQKATRFWKHRPFTRVIRGGRRAYNTVRNYIQLNAKEALGDIPYRKERLKALSEKKWQALWN